MSNSRLEKIKQLVTENNISTQDMLVEMLNNSGFSVTQATISRDIKKLGLTKSSEGGITRYVMPEKTDNKYNDAMIKNGIVSVKTAQNIVVIKCRTGLANAICVFLDQLVLNGLVGTLAGDDTIFLATENIHSAENIAHFLSLRIQ